MNNLHVFAQEINQLGQTILDNVVKLQKQVAVDVVDYVAGATPIKTGQASANWKTTINAPSSAWDMGATGGPSVSMAEVRSALAALREGQVVHIVNNVPYIGELNNGSSTQAPQNFVEVAAMSALQRSQNFNLLTRRS